MTQVLTTQVPTDIDTQTPATSGSDTPAPRRTITVLVGDALLSATATAPVGEAFNGVYSRIVGSVLGMGAKMESFNPPLSGEFTIKRTVKWPMVRQTLETRSVFCVQPDPKTNGFSVAIRARASIAPITGWLAASGSFGLVPFALGVLVELPVLGAAVSASMVIGSWMALAVAFVFSARKAARDTNAELIAALANHKAEPLGTGTSLKVALLPPRSTWAIPQVTQIDPDEAETFTFVPAPAHAKAAKPKALDPVVEKTPEKVPEKLTETPMVAAVEKPVRKARAKSLFGSKPTPVPFMADAQAQMKARMQADLDAQIEALTQARAELEATAPAPKPVQSPVHDQVAALKRQIEAEVETIAAKPAAPVTRAVSNARVGSRIKKFRTRTEATALPQTVQNVAAKPATTPAAAAKTPAPVRRKARA